MLGTGWFQNARHWLGIIWWIFPVILIAGGYLVPALRMPLSAVPVPDEMKIDLYFWLLISLALCSLWILSAFFFASDQTTSIAALRTDALVSFLVALAMSVTCAFLAARNNVAWALIMPTAAAVIDALVTADRAINNAAQRPSVHQRSTGP